MAVDFASVHAGSLSLQEEEEPEASVSPTSHARPFSRETTWKPVEGVRGKGESLAFQGAYQVTYQVTYQVVEIRLKSDRQ